MPSGSWGRCAPTPIWWSVTPVTAEVVVTFLGEFEMLADREDFGLTRKMIDGHAFFRFNDGDFVGRPAIRAAFERTWRGDTTIEDARFYLSDITVLTVDEDDKLVVDPDRRVYTDDQNRALTEFQERRLTRFWRASWNAGVLHRTAFRYRDAAGARGRTRAERCIERPADDQDSAVAFYTDRLRLRVGRDAPDKEGWRSLELEVPGARTRILPTRRSTGVQHDDGVSAPPALVLVVNDVDAFHARCAETGVTFVRPPAVPPWNPSGRYAFLHDNEGNVILFQSCAQVRRPDPSRDAAAGASARLAVSHGCIA